MYQTKQSQLRFDFTIPALRETETVTRAGADGKPVVLPKLVGGQALSGLISLVQIGKSTVLHEGVVVELIMTAVVGNKPIQVFNKTVQALPTGVIAGTQQVKFDFGIPEIPAETVEVPSGAFSIRCHVVCSVRQKKSALQGSQEFVYIEAVENNAVVPHKSEVGAEGALQVEIEAPNTTLDITTDKLVMKVHFLTAQKKMDEMRIIIRRRDGYRLTVTDAPVQTDWYDVYSYQVMDGAPVRNEVIPINLKLSMIKQLSPSFKTDLVKVEYQALISVFDTDGLSYFKEVPLQLYRAK